MSDTMSTAEIEALLARNAAATSHAPEVSPDAPAAAVPIAGGEVRAEAGPEVAPEPAPVPVPDGTSAPAPYAVAPTPDALLEATATAAEEPAAADARAARGDDDSAADAGAPASASTTIPGLFGQYGKYLALFVGAGLISGAVVHFPLAPVRYAVIGAVGALVFAVASVVSELGDRNPLRLARVAFSALALAVGIGMISGSIQHFTEVPDRAALLIPLGAVLSLVAFGIRHGLRLKRSDLALVVPWVIIAVFALGFGLGKLAEAAKPQGHGGGHGDEAGATAGHGSDAAAGHGGTAEGADDGHRAAGADGHGSDGEDSAAHGDKTAAGDSHAKASGHPEEDAHAAEDAHAEEGAHAGKDTHAGHSSARKTSGGKREKSELAAEDSHGGRLRIVP